jgi:hypothetical protein
MLAWRLSTGVDTGFCVEALQEAVDRHGSPEIFNSDPGRAVHLAAFTGVLAAARSCGYVDNATASTTSPHAHHQPQERDRIGTGAITSLPPRTGRGNWDW